MATFQENAQLTLKMLPAIQKLIAPSIWDLSSAWLDRNGAVDMVLRFSLSRGVALRTMRFNEHSEWDFTIRTKLRNGHRTEYHKFRDGCADMMFFGVLDRDETSFIRWMLISLDAWRLAESTAPWGLHRAYPGEVWNKDGLTAFRIYSATHPMLLRMHGFMIDCHAPNRYSEIVRRNGGTASNHTELAKCA